MGFLTLLAVFMIEERADVRGDGSQYVALCLQTMATSKNKSGLVEVHVHFNVY